MNRNSLENNNKILLYDANGIEHEFFQIREIGRGASCIVYYALAIDNTEHLLKEYYPLGMNIKRDLDNSLIISDESNVRFNSGKERFQKGCECLKLLRLEDSLKNYSTNIQGYYYANNTEYIDMSCFSGQTYDNVQETSLYNLMRRMKVLAQVVGYYHEKGYLHLDIKPSNVFVRPNTETIEDVLLFDCDSLVDYRSSDFDFYSVSYSENWAAMELTLPRKRNEIGPATDIFSIGEIIFYQIFGRHSCLTERRVSAEYRYDYNNTIFTNIDSKAFEKISVLFKKTICNSTKERFNSIAELISSIDEIIGLSDPEKIRLNSDFVTSKEFFVGRNNEIEAISSILSDSKIVILSGLGGIGKSEIVKQYVKKNSSQFDCILYTVFLGDWKSYLCDDNSISLSKFSKMDNESVEEYAFRKLNKIRELCSDNTLLIIDNLNHQEFEGVEEELFNEILNLNCKKIITSRINEWDYPVIEIGPFEELEDLLLLFKHNYDYCDEEEPDVLKLIDYFNKHTLAIELISKQVSASYSSPGEILEKLNRQGLKGSGVEKVKLNKDSHIKKATTVEHLTELFNISNISDSEVYVLSILALFSPIEINVKELKNMCNKVSYDTVNNLIENGWINRNANCISVHPIISEIILQLKRINDYEDFIVSLQKRINDTEKIKRNLNEIIQLAISVAKRICKYNLDSEITADFISSSTWVDLEIPEYTVSSSWFRHAIDTYNNLLSAEDFSINRIKAYANLGVVEYYLDEFDNSIADSMLAIEKIADRKEYLQLISEYYTTIGLAYDAKGDNLLFLDYTNKALEIAKSLPVSTDIWSLLLIIYGNLASHYELSNFEKAMAYNQEAITIIEKNKICSLEAATIYGNIANTYINQSNYIDAEKFAMKGYNMLDSIVSDTHCSKARIYTALADIYLMTGKTDLAEDYLNQALKIYKIYYGDQSSRMANVFNLIGGLYDQKNQPKEAASYFKKSLEIYTRVYGENHEETAWAYNNLASTYVDIATSEGSIDLSDPIQMLEKAIAIFEETWGTENPSSIYPIMGLARAKFNIGEYEKGLQLSYQAYSLSRKIYGDDNELTQNIYDKYLKIKNTMV